MNLSFTQFAADHRYLLDAAARVGKLKNPVAVYLGELEPGVLKAARKGEQFPLDGVLVTDWTPHQRKNNPGPHVGMRLYTIEGITLVQVCFTYADHLQWNCTAFHVVDSTQYTALYRLALKHRHQHDDEAPCMPPVLAPGQSELLWKNTIGYLEPANLRKLKEYGGRAKRGVLLMGAPGNGKTTACRWLWQECRKRSWEWRLVTPDCYRQARDAERSRSDSSAVKDLFSVQKRGIIFFDDMDMALRDRDTVGETEDQSVFLNALDGITINEGVVFVFTSNCAPELIDPAFKRPGRLDLVLQFAPPDALLRSELLGRWHEDIRAHLDLDEVVAATKGMSFAEIEELKNLLIMHFMEESVWDWSWAVEQFDRNRNGLNTTRKRAVGFGRGEAVTTGNGNGSTH